MQGAGQAGIQSQGQAQEFNTAQFLQQRLSEVAMLLKDVAEALVI